MKYEMLDKVMVEIGDQLGKVGTILSRSQIHRNSIPDTAKYIIKFEDNPIPQEFLETNLALYEKYDREKAEKEAKQKLLDRKAEADRQAELKMEEALRKKIQRELEIRAEVEAEFAAKKIQNTT